MLDILINTLWLWVMKLFLHQVILPHMLIRMVLFSSMVKHTRKLYDPASVISLSVVQNVQNVSPTRDTLMAMHHRWVKHQNDSLSKVTDTHTHANERWLNTPKRRDSGQD